MFVIGTFAPEAAPRDEATTRGAVVAANKSLVRTRAPKAICDAKIPTVTFPRGSVFHDVQGFADPDNRSRRRILDALRARAAVYLRAMGPKDYTAILSAVEQAIAVCDKYGDSLDDARRKICEDLRRVRGELRRQLGLPPGETC